MPSTEFFKEGTSRMWSFDDVGAALMYFRSKQLLLFIKLSVHRPILTMNFTTKKMQDKHIQKGFLKI